MTKRSPNLTLLLRLFVVGVIVFILDAAIGHYLRSQYFQMNWGELYRVTYALEKSHERLLIFGSSRAYVHYVPDVFEKKLAMDYYNVGQDSAGILYETAMLRGILARYRPEIIILDIRHDELAKNEPGYQMLSVLLPYYKDHKEIRSILDLRGPFEKIRLFSKTYPFNSQFLTILMANKLRWTDDKGFLPQSGTWNYAIEEYDPSGGMALDPNSVKLFLEFLETAKKHDISLYVVISPYYRIIREHAPSFRMASDMCEKHNVIFLDYSQDSRFLERPGFFCDPDHLNYEGAKMFSEILADRMTEINSGKIEK